MKEKKNILIIALLVAIVAMGVGYIALGETIAVSNSNDDWNVEISSIDSYQLVGATVNSADKIGKTSATFDVDLAYPGAYAIFNVVVTNKGDIDAKFDGFSSLTAINAKAPDYITYSVSGISEGEILSAGGDNTHVATITVKWDGKQEENSTDLTSKTSTITLDYVQEK